YAKLIGTAPGVSQAVDELMCNAHLEDLMVDAQGNASLCGKLTLGNLLQLPLEELWNSNTAGQFRTQVEDDRSPCMECDYRQRCISPSMARIDNYFSDEVMQVLPSDVRVALRYDRKI